MRYLVTYEIQRPHPDYPPLMAVLRSLRATRVLPAAWVLESDLTAFDVCRHIIAVGKLGTAERILVVALGADAAWHQLGVSNAEAAVRFGDGEAPAGAGAAS